MEGSKRRLAKAVDFQQFLTDADNVDTWMLSVLKQVSSECIGKDESDVQIFLKKHKKTTDEIKTYSSTIDALHKRGSTLGEYDMIMVQERLDSIDKHYKELQGITLSIYVNSKSPLHFTNSAISLVSSYIVTLLSGNYNTI